jgi:dihydroorotase
MAQRLTIRRPDDWHVHVRDGAMLRACLPCTARCFGRAILMPNLVPPVRTTTDAIAYRSRVMAALPAGSKFTPLITCYLTDDTDPDEVERGFREGVFAAVKLYPAHATSNSAHGVTDYRRIEKVLARMESIGMRLLVHGEDNDPAVDVFDREAVFVERRLIPIAKAFPALKIVLEHVSSRIGVDYVLSAAPQVAATVTPHHLELTRTQWLGSGNRPHMYCMPVVKSEADRAALRRAATSGHRSFFLGTDSAPHAIARKLAAVGAAGVFNAPVAIETYAKVFEEEGQLDKLEAFAALNGPAHYALPVNEDTIALERTSWTVPEEVPVEGPDAGIAVYRGGETIAWRVAAS